MQSKTRNELLQIRPTRERVRVPVRNIEDGEEEHRVKSVEKTSLSRLTDELKKMALLMEKIQAQNSVLQRMKPRDCDKEGQVRRDCPNQRRHQLMSNQLSGNEQRPKQ